MNPFQFSMLQNAYPTRPNMGQNPQNLQNPGMFNDMGQSFNIQSLMQNNPMLSNPYAMGIPNNSQTSPYAQYEPYAPGGSPYTQLGQPPQFSGVPSINDYFDPFETLRQQMQDNPAQQNQSPVASNPNQGQVGWYGSNPLIPESIRPSGNPGVVEYISKEEADKRKERIYMNNYWARVGDGAR